MLLCCRPEWHWFKGVTVATWTCHWLGSPFLLRESKVISYWKNRAPKWDLSLCIMGFVSVKQVAISVLLLHLDAKSIARHWTWCSLCVPSNCRYSILWLNDLFRRADKWSITKPREKYTAKGQRQKTQDICCSLETEHRENQPSHWGRDCVMDWEVELGGFSISVLWSSCNSMSQLPMDTKITKRRQNHSVSFPGTVSVGEYHILDPLGPATSFLLSISLLGHNLKLLLPPDPGLFVLLSNSDLCLLPTVNSSVWGESKLSCGTRQPNLQRNVAGGGGRSQEQDRAGKQWLWAGQHCRTERSLGICWLTGLWFYKVF